MSGEGGASPECLPTLRTVAGARPAVESLVHRQVRVLPEGLAALGAPVWRLPGDLSLPLWLQLPPKLHPPGSMSLALFSPEVTSW